MTTSRTFGRQVLGSGLLAIALTWPAVAEEPMDASVLDISRYQALKAAEPAALELMLSAMADTAFYAHESVGRSAICATPATIPGPRLVELVDAELAKPSDPAHPQYADNERLALVLVNVLKKEGACE
jgi:hypothetical protein